MSGKSKDLPQNYTQMLSDSAERRQNSKLYKAEGVTAQDERLSAIVEKGAAELAQLAETGERLTLTDTEAVKARTLLYLRACADTSSLPTWSGLLRSFGMTTRAGYDFRRRRPDHPTTHWLELCHDAFADMLADAALRGLSNTVFSIFVSKARNGWDDTFTLDDLPEEPERKQTAQEIRLKYQDMPDD